jgi:nucleoside-diphosphate-sugar epimerase
VIIAVTGASGFIGRHVLEELCKKSIDVIAVTRNVSRLKNFPSEIHIIELDIGLSGKDSFSQMGCPEILIHLAWDGLPNYRSLHHFESELPKHYFFLKSLVKSGLKSLLVSGTCFEYGLQSGALSEKMRTCPNNPYGFAKDILRQQLEFLKAEKPYNLTWGRIFYTYGEGQASNSLYSQLKEAVFRGDRVFNMSGGEQLRDYLPVTEVAQKIVEAALSGSDIGTINICSGKPISIRTLVEQWVIENQWEIYLNFGYYPYPDYEPMAFWGDSTRFRKIFPSC